MKWELNRGQEDFYYRDPGFPNKLQIFSRFPDEFFIPILDEPGIAIRRLAPPVGIDVLLVAVHLPSKLHQDEHDQIFEAVRLSKRIVEEEEKLGQYRSIVIGDFNMNPFEHGMVGSKGLHAISDRQIAVQGHRFIRGDDYRFFYNPMWNCFGDIGKTTPGTYFYNSGSHVNYYWHVFDQILIRPELLDMFNDDGVKVITEISGQSLLSDSGRPDHRNHSDHLPVLLTLTF